MESGAGDIRDIKKFRTWSSVLEACNHPEEVIHTYFLKIISTRHSHMNGKTGPLEMKSKPCG